MAKTLVLDDVVKTRAEHPRAVFCPICEGVEFRIERGEPDTIECLRCGRRESVFYSPAPPDGKRRKEAETAIDNAYADVEDAIDDAIDALESAKRRLR